VTEGVAAGAHLPFVPATLPRNARGAVAHTFVFERCTREGQRTDWVIAAL